MRCVCVWGGGALVLEPVEGEGAGSGWCAVCAGVHEWVAFVLGPSKGEGAKRGGGGWFAVWALVHGWHWRLRLWNVGTSCASVAQAGWRWPMCCACMCGVAGS
jgi:hypothetical protein